MRSRALVEVAERYEAKMYWLKTIVSELPFSTCSARYGAHGRFRYHGQGSHHRALGSGGFGRPADHRAALAAIPIFAYNHLLGTTRSCMTKLENFASNLVNRIELENYLSRTVERVIV